MRFSRYLTHPRTSGGCAESFLSLFDALPYFQGGYANALLSLLDALPHIQGVCQFIFVAI